MTTLIPEYITCAICGQGSNHQFLGSSNRFGFPDLDFRPPPMLRNTLPHWIQQCPHCGYCNKDLGVGLPHAEARIASSQYQMMLNNRELPALAVSFSCFALLIAPEKPIDAAQAYLNAAWVCDDDRDDTMARECRRNAINILQTLQPFPHDEKGLWMGLVLIDLLRRCAEFQSAEAARLDVEKFEITNEASTKICAFQKVLIDQKDAKAYSLSDAP